MSAKWFEDYPLSFMRRARSQLNAAELHLESYQYSECISCCIEAMELFLISIFLLIKRDYPPKHAYEWKESEIIEVLKKIPIEVEDMITPNIANFPRMFLLASFWAKFYTISKYGQKEFNVGADRLFKSLDAELALKHTKEFDFGIVMLTNYLERNPLS